MYCIYSLKLGPLFFCFFMFYTPVGVILSIILLTANVLMLIKRLVIVIEYYI